MELVHTKSAQPPGWLRWAAIGCAPVLALLLLALIGGAASRQKLLGFGLVRLEDRVTRSLADPSDSTARERLRLVFDCVIRAVANGRLSDEEVGVLGRACSTALAHGKVSATDQAEIARVAAELCARANGAVR